MTAYQRRQKTSSTKPIGHRRQDDGTNETVEAISPDTPVRLAGPPFVRRSERFCYPRIFILWVVVFVFDISITYAEDSTDHPPITGGTTTELPATLETTPETVEETVLPESRVDEEETAVSEETGDDSDPMSIEATPPTDTAEIEDAPPLVSEPLPIADTLSLEPEPEAEPLEPEPTPKPQPLVVRLKAVPFDAEVRLNGGVIEQKGVIEVQGDTFYRSFELELPPGEYAITVSHPKALRPFQKTVILTEGELPALVSAVLEMTPTIKDPPPVIVREAVRPKTINWKIVATAASITTLYAFLEYRNAEEASKRKSEEESRMLSATTADEARYHQGKAEEHCDLVNKHYNNTLIGGLISVNLFTLAGWLYLDESADPVPKKTFRVPLSPSQHHFRLSWQVRW